MERKADCVATTSARSISASAKTMWGDLPPHSKVQRFRLPAASCMILRAVAWLPVKEILFTPRWAASAAPAVAPKPGTTLKTPAGKPASATSLAISSAVTGVCSAGLTTMALPAAKSRTDLPRIEQDRRIPGQDGADHAHGLPARIGQRVRLEGNLLALDLVGGAGEEISQSTARCTSPTVSRNGLPLSRLSSSASCAASRRTSSASFSSRAPRWLAVILVFHGPAMAARAAATALFTSSSSASATSAQTSSVEGSIEAMARPECGATHSPPI